LNCLLYGQQGADRTFKVRFGHKVGPEGGVEIVEVLPERGSPDGEVVVRLTNLEDVERFYNQAPMIFQRLRPLVAA
jgi:hypothetical protein